MRLMPNEIASTSPSCAITTTRKIPGVSVSDVRRLSLEPMMPATAPLTARPSTIHVKTRWRNDWKKVASPRPRAYSMLAGSAPARPILPALGARGARQLDGGRGALRPRLAVAEQEGVGLQPLDPVQRGEGLLGAGRERLRHEARAALAGERVVGAQRVAGEAHAPVLEAAHAVALRVARRVHHARTARDLQDVAVGVGLHRLDRRDPQRTL